jgi:hypothetical protein
MKPVLYIAIAVALTGCGSTHRAASGTVTNSYVGGARGIATLTEASADLNSVDGAVSICREAIENKLPCTAFDSRTGRPIAMVGGFVPYGAFGVGGAYTDQAAALAESRRLQRENAALRGDVQTLSRKLAEEE